MLTLVLTLTQAEVEEETSQEQLALSAVRRTIAAAEEAAAKAEEKRQQALEVGLHTAVKPLLSHSTTEQFDSHPQLFAAAQALEGERRRVKRAEAESAGWAAREGEILTKMKRLEGLKVGTLVMYTT
eukprot:759780-Prorocentrum_minimum.AAC.1